MRRIAAATLLFAALTAGGSDLPPRTVTRSCGALTGGGCWQEVVTHSVKLPRVTLRSAAANREILRQVRAQAIAQSEYDEADRPCPAECSKTHVQVARRTEDVTCETTLQRASLVAVRCHSFATTGNRPGGYSEFLNFFVDGERVRLVDDAEFFASDAALTEFARLAWNEKAAHCADRPPAFDPPVTDENADAWFEHAKVSFSQRGIVVENERSPCGRRDPEVVIPLDRVGRLLSPDLRNRLGIRFPRRPD